MLSTLLMTIVHFTLMMILVAQSLDNCMTLRSLQVSSCPIVLRDVTLDVGHVHQVDEVKALLEPGLEGPVRPDDVGLGKDPPVLGNGDFKSIHT